MKSAWLVTWEWFGDHAASEEKVVAIINYRKGADYVKDLMEQVYIERTSTASEKLSYAKYKDGNPYPAKFLTLNGVAWQGRINCGHNPYLYGRLVSNLRVEICDGVESVLWEERSVPKLN